MGTKIVAIWFPHLITDWMLRHQADLKNIPFALTATVHSRKIIKAVNTVAHKKGVYVNMVVADCRAIVPDLKIFDYDSEQANKLLSALAEWCMRYTPFVSINLPDGLMLDASGCTHLWKGDANYLQDLNNKLSHFGYTIRIAMAQTMGAAWALSRFGKNGSILNRETQREVLATLPPAALRLEMTTLERLQKLGLTTIGSFINMPRTALRRRFGKNILIQIDRALGYEMEMMTPIRPVAPYREQLPCIEPICTNIGIEIALKTLLPELCQRLNLESKGLRKCELQCYRVDGNIQKINISTSRASRNAIHLFKLFENRIVQIEPGLGIELFILEASVVEELQNSQDTIWAVSNKNEIEIAELLDRLIGKTGLAAVHRYLPAEHYWPERSVKNSLSLAEKPASAWRTDQPRPLHLLEKPEAIGVTVPIPDYPPLLFKYKGVLHTVKKADGPERIEHEWWLSTELYRDYYCVEDERGARYWLFRSGNYNNGDAKWFLHGFFA